MLPDRSQLYLEQILDAIGKIELATAGLSEQAYEQYEVKWLVERGLEIIGEALKRLAHAAPSIEIEHSKSIIGTRNKIAHEYDVVDPAILHAVVTRHLPKLKEEIERILAS